MDITKKAKNVNPAYASSIEWSSKSPSLKEGVIVGADLTQEWILPWWWKHYKKSNNFPVTFVDFGMSDRAKTWCRRRGRLRKLPIADIFVSEKQEINTSSAKEWEETYGKEFWMQRNGWFKKPMACLLSPYEKSIWIDLDCEVRGSLGPLFTSIDHPSGLAISKDIHDPIGGQKGYNSGVIAFKHGLPLIEQWAKLSLEENHLFAGDQDILTKIIFDQELSIQELPQIYNWSRCSGESPDAVVFHWHGRHGKTFIASQYRQNDNFFI